MTKPNLRFVEGAAMANGGGCAMADLGNAGHAV